MTIVHVTRLSFANSNGIKTVLSNLIPSQQKLGCQIYVFNLTNNNQAIFNNELYIGQYSSFIKNIETISPDVVVFHGGYELNYYVYAHFLRKRHISYIIVPHGGTSRFNLQKRKLLKKTVNALFTRYFIKKSAGVIFLNEGERSNSVFRNSIKNYGIVPNGVCLPSYDTANKPKNKKIEFIFLSRIDIKFKGLDILLKAIENVHVRYPEVDFNFHFYGGRYNPAIVENFKELIACTNAPVVYHGEVSGKDKEDAYLNANIYVLTSLSEGMPVTVLEALSYGNPCIVTPQTNMGDIIEKNHAGWITQPEVASITNTLLQAYVNYTDQREMYIKNAIEAVAPYSWANVAQKSIQEYSLLINKQIN